MVFGRITVAHAGQPEFLPLNRRKKLWTQFRLAHIQIVSVRLSARLTLLVPLLREAFAAVVGLHVIENVRRRACLERR